MSQAIPVPDFTETSAASVPGVVGGSHRTLLRVEGALMLLAGVASYRALGGSWGWFAACFLLPDVTLAGYAFGSRAGAVIYNAGHALIGPALLAGMALALSLDVLLLASAVWLGHIGFDRMLGYGLKATTSFRDTHLGRI